MNNTISKKLSKKEARQLVYNKLVVALSEFKAGIKVKKFESNLLKATKLFADDMAKASGKSKDKAKKNAKKKVKPAEEVKVPA